jgi:hypothetical protein
MSAQTQFEVFNSLAPLTSLEKDGAKARKEMDAELLAAAATLKNVRLGLASAHAGSPAASAPSNGQPAEDATMAQMAMVLSELEVVLAKAAKSKSGFELEMSQAEIAKLANDYKNICNQMTKIANETWWEHFWNLIEKVVVAAVAYIGAAIAAVSSIVDGGVGIGLAIALTVLAVASTPVDWNGDTAMGEVTAGISKGLQDLGVPKAWADAVAAVIVIVVTVVATAGAGALSSGAEVTEEVEIEMETYSINGVKVAPEFAFTAETATTVGATGLAATGVEGANVVAEEIGQSALKAAAEKFAAVIKKIIQEISALLGKLYDVSIGKVYKALESLFAPLSQAAKTAIMVGSQMIVQENLFGTLVTAIFSSDNSKGEKEKDSELKRILGWIATALQVVIGLVGGIACFAGMTSEAGEVASEASGISQSIKKLCNMSNLYTAQNTFQAMSAVPQAMTGVEYWEQAVTTEELAGNLKDIELIQTNLGMLTSGQKDTQRHMQAVIKGFEDMFKDFGRKEAAGMKGVADILAQSAV